MAPNDFCACRFCARVCFITWHRLLRSSNRLTSDPTYCMNNNTIQVFKLYKLFDYEQKWAINSKIHFMEHVMFCKCLFFEYLCGSLCYMNQLFVARNITIIQSIANKLVSLRKNEETQQESYWYAHIEVQLITNS